MEAAVSDEVLTQAIAPPLHVSPFAPLRHRNFRLLWTGFVISNTGSWMQFTALGYLMDQLTLAPVFLGLLGLAQAVPRLLFAFLGGVIADRVDRRSVLLITNSVTMISSLALALLTSLDLVRVWHLLVIASFNSFVHSFEMPARQSMMPSLVSEPEILQAVSLNSMAFNGAGVFGPAIAGVVISLVGTPGAFFLNALSYVAVLWALLAMQLPAFVSEGRVSFGQDIREGLALMARHRVVLVLLAAVAVLSFFGRPYIRLMPAVAREVLHVGPRGLGVLQAAPGLGTILVVFAIGWSARRLRKGGLLLAAAFAMGAMVTFFGFSGSFALSVALLIGIGVCQSAAMATANTLIQITVPPGARGRAMGLFGTVAFGMMALGVLPAGALAEVLNLSWSLALGGIILMVVMLTIGLTSPAIRRL
jgi:MFS family permease